MRVAVFLVGHKHFSGSAVSNMLSRSCKNFVKLTHCKGVIQLLFLIKHLY